ncbi:MAG: hypothetical protein ACXWMJ_05700 [Syntrophales bacterium]
MRKLTMGIVLVVAISMMFVPVAFAQGGGGSRSDQWGIGTPSTLTESSDFTGNESILVQSGKVVAMEPMKGVKNSLQMKFKNDQGNVYTVYMGPKWFIENQKIKFMAGDSVLVKGKKIGSYIIATAISKDDWTMTLRDENDGSPRWECCNPGTVESK